MIRPVLFALMFSGSVFALSPTAYAQTSPDTRQTDQSEEDWRKSKKKGGTDSEDILDIIKNTRSTGVGNGRGYSPIDALPEESRRHLMKERAKRMAQAGPNEAVDVSYTPSEAAKSDSNLQDDEKKAWEKMAQGMNGAPDQGQGQGQGQGQQGQQGQSQQGQQQGGGGSGQQGQQQGGGQSSDPSAQSGSSRSVMRGGSAASVSDIMARIKGLGPAGGQTGNGGTGQSPTGQGRQQGQAQTGQSPFSQGQQGQDSQGQMPQGQSPQGQTQPSSQGQQGQSSQEQGQQGQNQNQSQSQSQSQSQQEGQQQSNSQSQADAEAKAQADAASKATSAAQDQNAAQAQSPQRVPKAVSPLDRLKKINREQTNSGSRSSASDYLKKKE